MKEALKAFPLVYVEMEPGDALFFHCNLLHSSDQNNSDMRRWAMITSFNQRHCVQNYKHKQVCLFYLFFFYFSASIFGDKLKILK
jgi:ectoine hydroxylase-related dioxygenase (phytanoyl-CoA dioxygenase family)